MKVRCMLVDDEPLAIRLISSYLKQIDCAEVIATCSSAMEAFAVLQKQQVDLMFLDIKMPKMLGTDFLRSLLHPPKVIIISAYREYALDGFDLEVVDYLLKPVSLNRFMKAVAKAVKLLEMERHIQEIPAENKEPQPSSLYFKVDREMKKVRVDQILFVESRKEYVKMYLEQGVSFVVKQSISSLENVLPRERFMRVHRSFIVASGRVNGYDAGHLKVEGHIIPIGRLFKHDVRKKLASG